MRLAYKHLKEKHGYKIAKVHNPTIFGIRSFRVGHTRKKVGGGYG
jgi:hypothetical protein